MNLVRLGIIGCGAAALRYYVPAIKRYPELINNLCLVDKDLEQAKQLANKIGGGRIFDNYEALIGNVDGVIIALPHKFHFPVGMHFLKSGIHVLCEKPLAETLEQAEMMCTAAEVNKVHLCVNNTRRMFPAFQAIKKIIDSNIIGDLESINYIEGNSFAWPSNTGFYVDPSVTDKGIVMDLGPHVLDTICWWLEGGKTKINSCYDDSFGGPESVTHINAKNKNCDIDIKLNRLMELENQYTIIGKKGVIKGKIFDWFKFSIEMYNGKKEIHIKKTKAKIYPDFVKPIINNFIETIQGKEKPLISGKDVLGSINMIQEFYRLRKQFCLPWYQKLDLPPMPKEEKILITGATGFIGCRIVEILHMNGYSNIRAGIRQWSTAARLGRFPVDIVLMDLLRKEDIYTALTDVKYIIHCAKGTDGATDLGTRNLLEIAFENKIKHFVHLSTTEVYGGSEGEIDENTPLKYTGNEYNRAKIDAEKACWEFFEKGLPVTILRPSIVYGIFSSNWTVRFVKMMLEGKFGVYDKHGEGYSNLIYVDDLARAIFSILYKNQTFGQAYNIVGPELLTWNEYFYKLNRCLGLPPLKNLPASYVSFKTSALYPLRIAGKIIKKHFMAPVKILASNNRYADKLLRKTEETLKNTPASEELSLYSRKSIFINKKFQSLDNKFEMNSLDTSLKIIYDWLDHQGVI
ncbi:MAG: NAD-dependent epimerase/dehydratase family protein [Syntrophotaleaceae bacterium]